VTWSRGLFFRSAKQPAPPEWMRDVKEIAETLQPRTGWTSPSTPIPKDW